jgi:autotransporter-associated beta strand protein
VGRAQFNGTFDFTGDVQVLANGNFLTISAPSLESVDIASSGYWTLVGGRISETKILTGSGTITKNAANDLATLEVGGTSSSSSFSGVIGQTAFTALGTVALSKVGSGTLILSGANTYTGGTTVSAGGTLRLENTSGAGTGGITINNSTLSLYRSAEPTTYTNTITIPTGTTGFLNVDGRGSNVGTSLNQTYDTGAITVNGTLTIARPTGGTGHTYFNSDVTGTGILKIDNTNAGVAPSTSSLGRCALMGTFGFTGDVEVLAGGNFTAPNVSVNSIDIAAGGYWTLGSNPTTKMLTGSGTITHSNSPGATTILQVGGTSSSSTFNGVIGVNFLLGQGTVGLNKVGTGTLVLGGDNTYNGGTTITAGSITCNHVNALGTSGAITVNAGATLNKNGTNCGAGRITCNGLCPD